MSSRSFARIVTLAAIALGSGVLLAEDAPDVKFVAPPATQPAATEKPAATAKVSADARQLLDQVNEAYGKLKSLGLAGTLSSDIEAAGQKQQQSTTFTASYQAPNKFRHTLKDEKDEMTWGSTGEKAYSYLKSRNIYTSSDAARERTATRELPQPLSDVIPTQNPSLQLAVAKDAVAELTTGATELSKGEDTKLGDNNYATLNVDMKDKRRLTLLVDPQSHLVRQARTDVKPLLESRGTPDVKHAMITVDYTTVTPDATVQDQQFAWKPPQGARDLAAGGGGGEEQSPATALQGKPAPDFKLTGLDGKSVALADLKGSVVIVDFWATWCGPCRQSLPHLNKLYDEKKAAGLKVFAVNLQEEKDEVRKFVDSTKLTVPVLLDTDGATAKNYAAQAIPETVIIGKDGIVKKVFVGFGPGTEAEMHKTVAALLEEK